MGCAYGKGALKGQPHKKIAAQSAAIAGARYQFLPVPPLASPPAEQPAAPTGVVRRALIVGPAIAIVAVGIPIPAPGRGAVTVALADLDAALRLAAHQHHEIGGLARLAAQTFVGNDDRRARGDDLTDAGHGLLRYGDALQRIAGSFAVRRPRFAAATTAVPGIGLARGGRIRIHRQ